MKKIISILTTFVLIVTFSQKTFASHTAGGELIYKKVVGTTNTYTFYFKFYRNCGNLPTSGIPPAQSASSEPNSFTLCYTSPCTGNIQQIVMPKITGLIPTTPPVQNGSTLSNGCDSTITQCENLSSTIPGYEQWWYSANVTLPTQCNDWRFWVDLCCRNNNIINIGNAASSGYDLYVETRFDNLSALNAQDNSSPYFLNSNSSTSLPIPYMCVNNPYFHNGGAFDDDGDSLHFEMINPRDGVACVTGTAPSILSPGYNLNSTAGQPMDCNNTFNLDPNTGNFSLTPNVVGKFVLSIKCSEYRNGILLGSIMRDMQVVVDNCIQMPVSTVLDSINIQNGSVFVDTVKSCPGNNLNFCFDLVSASGIYLLHLFDNSSTAFPGSTLNISNIDDSTLHYCMTWQPTLADTGYHTLFLNVKDSVNCLTNPALLPITLYIHKPITASNDTTICVGETIKLWAKGNTGFSWNVLPGGSNINTLNCLSGKCDTVTVTPTQTTSYVVTDTVCGFKDTVVVNIVFGPNTTITPDTTTCVNSSVQIGVTVLPTTQLYNYSWLPATGLSSTTISNPIVNGSQMTGNTTYSVTVSAQGILACPSTATVTVDLLNGFDITNKAEIICDGDTVQIASTGGNPKYTFAWTPTNFVSNPTILNTKINPNPFGNYNYSVTASYPGCPDSTQNITIEVQPIPIVIAGADREICNGDTVHMLGSVTPMPGTYTYQWSPAADLNDGTILDPIFDGINSTVFTLTATTPLGCQGSDIMNINVLSVDFMNITQSDTNICPGEIVSLVAGGAINYLWSPSWMVSDSVASSVTVKPISTTMFQVYGVDNKGCKDTVQATVIVNPNGVINLGPSQTIYPGQSVQLYANGNCSSFTFEPPFGLSATNIKDPIAQPSVTTKYIVTGYTEDGCKVKDSIDIFVSPESFIEMENAFSPGSGTSINDEYKIILNGEAKLNTFKIFNRWGEQVFSTTDINKGWNGQFNGKPQPMGVYIYVVDATSTSGKRFTKQGNLTLIR